MKVVPVNTNAKEAMVWPGNLYISLHGGVDIMFPLVIALAWQAMAFWGFGFTRDPRVTVVCIS